MIDVCQYSLKKNNLVTLCLKTRAIGGHASDDQTSISNEQVAEI
jgi:hypothetical protein